MRMKEMMTTGGGGQHVSHLQAQVSEEEGSLVSHLDQLSGSSQMFKDTLFMKTSICTFT